MFRSFGLRLIWLVTSGFLVCTVIADLLWTKQYTTVPASLSRFGGGRFRSSNADAPPANIGKILMSFGNPPPSYERALAGHVHHADLHGYPMFVLREQVVEGRWSKQAYILEVLLNELSKPVDQRLKWLAWFDTDIVIMNPKIPLDIFLPPEDKWSHINAIVTNDHQGLNNGAFFLRVHEWSVFLLVASMGTEIYDPTVQLQFDEQTAMEAWIHKDRFRNEVMHVPQRWFNAYAGRRGGRGKTSDPAKPLDREEASSCKEGDLGVHHAGHRSLREQRMLPWLDMAEQHSPAWEMDLKDTTYPKEIKEFWAKEAPLERKKVDKMIERMNERNAAYAAKKAQEVEKKKAEQGNPVAAKTHTSRRRGGRITGQEPQS